MVRGRDSARTQHDQVFRLCDVCFRFVCFCFTTLSPPMEVDRPVGGTIGLQVASAAPASATLGAVSVRAQEQTHHPFVCCLSPNLSFFCSQTKVWPAPAGGAEEPRETRTGRGGEHGCFVLNDKIEAGGAPRGVVRDGARGGTCAGAVRLHRAAACSESLHLLEHLRQTFYKCQGLPALVQPLLAK